MSIIVNRYINFIDSLQFVNASPDNLASNLKNEDFRHLMSEFAADKLEMLKQKMHFLMSRYILMKNLNTKPYPLKKTSTHH